MVVTLGQHYNVGEKPAVILYTHINRHAEQPRITKQYIVESVAIRYDNSAIEPCKNRGLGQQ